jgi:hypothetical protein
MISPDIVGDFQHCGINKAGGDDDQNYPELVYDKGMGCHSDKGFKFPKLHLGVRVIPVRLSEECQSPGLI